MRSVPVGTSLEPNPMILLFPPVSEMLVGLDGVVAILTVTLQLLVLPPSAVFVVMLQLPFATAVTTPLLFTVATALLSVLHVTDLLSALEGLTVALNCVVSLAFVSVTEDGATDTELTGTGILTVTLQVAVLPPSAVFTVILQLPFPTAVTTPLFTVATALLSVPHVTDLLSALDGDTVAVRVVVAPLLVNVAEVSFRLTELTATVVGAMFTVTLQYATA